MLWPYGWVTREVLAWGRGDGRLSTIVQDRPPLLTLRGRDHELRLRELLGVELDASHASIRSAYRGIAKHIHPDVNPTPSAEHDFKVATMAYRALTDGRAAGSAVGAIHDGISVPTEGERPPRWLDVTDVTMVVLCVIAVFGGLQVLSQFARVLPH